MKRQKLHRYISKKITDVFVFDIEKKETLKQIMEPKKIEGNHGRRSSYNLENNFKFNSDSQYKHRFDFISTPLMPPGGPQDKKMKNYITNCLSTVGSLRQLLN